MMMFDIPEKWTDIPEKIYNDAKNLPKEIINAPKEWHDMVNDMHNLKANLSDINNFVDKLRGGYEWIVDLFNTPLHDLLNATVLPVTFLCLVVGILFMMFSRKWGSRLLKIGGIWFIVGQILLAVQGAV